MKLQKVRLPVEQRGSNELASAKVRAMVISRSWTGRMLRRDDWQISKVQKKKVYSKDLLKLGHC